MHSQQNTINNTGTSESTFNPNAAEQLFELFSYLVIPLKDLESKIHDKNLLMQRRLKALEAARPSLIAILFQTLRHTFMFAIPFLVVFFILTNVIHLSDGQSLYSFFDSWAGHLFFVEYVLDWYTSIGYKGVLISLLSLLVVSLFCFVLVPCVTVLLPIMLIVNISSAVISMFMANKELRSGKKEIEALDIEIDTICSNLVHLLRFVPRDYRFSAALEHFCSSYYNGRVSNLQEAIEAFKTDLHRAQMEHEQQLIINTQLDMLKEIQYQSSKIDSLKHTVDRVKNKVDWL